MDDVPRDIFAIAYREPARQGMCVAALPLLPPRIKRPSV